MSSILDEWFPEAAERAKKAKENFKGLPVQKYPWRCEDEIKGALDAFADLWPECIPRGSKASLYAAARELVREVGEANAPRFIEWAHDLITRQNPDLHIKTPRSLLFLVAKWRLRGGDDVCPICGLSYQECPHEWGGERRRRRYDPGSAVGSGGDDG